MHSPRTLDPIDRTITITLSADEVNLVQWLAQETKTTPEHLLADFVADLASSNRSGGSDERECAFAWFKRRGYAGRYLYQSEAASWRDDVESERSAKWPIVEE